MNDYDPAAIRVSEVGHLAKYSAEVGNRYAAAKQRVWEEGHKPDRDISYGTCPRGGDPRDYYPDLACCTREEVLRWAEACDLRDRGDRHPEGPYPASTVCTRDESFGIGVYFFAVPPARVRTDPSPGWAVL